MLVDNNFLFNDGYVLHIRSENVAIRRWLNIVSEDYGGQMTPGDECDSNFLTFVLQLSMSDSPGDVSEEPVT